MGLLGGLPPDDEVAVEPLVVSGRNPPKVWGTMEVEGDSLVVRLSGWRIVWAFQREVRVPLASVIGVAHDPGAYLHVSRRLRRARRAHTTLFKLGSQHGYQGWSFWACGLARNAVVVELTGVRYRFLVVEVADPGAVVQRVREAAGLRSPKPSTRPAARTMTGRRVARPAKQQPGDRQPSQEDGATTNGPGPGDDEMGLS